MSGETKMMSNIFDQTTVTTSATNAEPVSAETTAAGKLIDHLKWVADTAVTQAGDRANWLGLAANAGQNVGQHSMVKGELVKPDPLDRSKIFQSSFNLPSLATLTVPTIPDGLKIDVSKINADTKADLDALKNSWLTQFLPAVTDVSALTKLSDNILNGTNQATVATKLSLLEGELSAALDTVINSTSKSMDDLLTTVKAAIVASAASARTGVSNDGATAKTNIGANLTSAQAGVAGALDAAKDNATNIAWARARDAAAREGARQEAEAVTGWASRGWSMPGGALAGLAQKARQATLNAASEMAAQQAEKQQQLFFDAARASVEAYLRAMDAQSTADLAILRADIDASLHVLDAQSSADLSVYKDSLDAKLRFADLQNTAKREKVRQAFEHLGLQLDFTKFTGDLAVKYRLGVIEGLNDLIRAYAALKGNETEYLAAITRAQDASVQALVEYYRAAIASAEMGMRVDLQNNENDLRWSTIAAQFIGTAVGHHVQAAGAATDVFARIAAMALSGMNGIASVAASV
jgi:hypothetical protein